jgi:CDP-glycerol glycerophosphotransferase
MSRIPKIIHYCWFGGNPLPPKAIECIDSWKKYLPDYEIKEWNETNFDIHCCKYVEESYNAKKWAFVVDYVRYFVVYHEGGVYFDTDTEVIKPFDTLLNDDAFFGFGAKGLTIPTFGAIKGHTALRRLINDYNNRSFIMKDGSFDTLTVNKTTERILCDYYGLVMNGQEQLLIDNIRVYPKEYFFSTDWQTGIITRNPNLFVIHYADGSWLSDDQKLQSRLIRRYVRVLGKTLGTRIGVVAYYIEKDGIHNLFIHAYRYIRRKTSQQFMKISNRFFFNRRKVIFSNFAGRGYGDNPKYIAEEFLSRKMQYKLIWIVNPNTKYYFPKGISTVKKGTFRELFELATAKFWVDNNRKEHIITKQNNQIYIQTWHGFYPFKKIEKDAESALSADYVKNAIHDAKMTDLMISGCQVRSELYKQSFWYSGEIMECGSPRNDILFKTNSCRDKIYNQYGLKSNQKIVLYAPTFRDNHNISAYDINFSSLLETLKLTQGGEWVCFLRLHPAVHDKSHQMSIPFNCIDVSSYDDIQELFVASEILITDYSNCMFEFALTKKPVLIYATDIDEYVKTRNFYYDIKSLPFSVATNNSELINILKSLDLKEYETKIEEFMSNIGSFEKGEASKTVVDYIVLKT